MLKIIGITIAGIAAFLATTLFWLKSLLPPPIDQAKLQATEPHHIPYITRALPENRGKILIVVSSATQMGQTGKPTGYELTELARPYYVFTTNGFEVDITSPKGGQPRAVLDDDDMAGFDYAFLNDPIAQEKISNSLPLEQAASGEYAAVFFVGGKGAMFDFPQNPDINRLIRDIHSRGGVIAAVCHGPAALTGVRLADGTPLVAGKKVTGFTNSEELLLIPNAREVFPFLLEDELRRLGAQFEPGPDYLEQVSQDNRILTGQNPWSVWPLADAVVEQLGYQPVSRQVTAEENTVEVLLAFKQDGTDTALATLEEIYLKRQEKLDRRLLAMHGLVAVMQGKPTDSVRMIRLLRHAKRLEEKAQNRGEAQKVSSGGHRSTPDRIMAI